VCGPYDSEPSRTYIEAKQILDCLDSVGIIQKLEPLTYPEFATLDTRLKSFDKCLITLIQDINVLCEAGFFYNGKIIYILYILIYLLYYCNIMF